jgi:hypothetical protein
VAITLSEQVATDVKAELDRHDELFTSNLTEAEVRAACLREGVKTNQAMFGALGWIQPDRSLSEEITRVLDQGYLRGADLWHIANALFLSPDPTQLAFLTLDQRQGEVAAALGFPTPL